MDRCAAGTPARRRHRCGTRHRAPRGGRPPRRDHPGPRRALALDADGVVEVPSEPVAVVDVTGGGDALVAGTVAAIVEGAGLADAVRRGVRLAGLTIAVHGAVRPDLAAAARAG